MSYSDKAHINLLTSLLVAHHVRHAVVCPGSRNAPIVHNLNAHPAITCHPVTDERSAGFYALGMAQVLQQPVAVCVTSGTALLNLAPAVAEAYYQHLPVVVISADRPGAWIGQLDGQTLSQEAVFAPFVHRSVSLPEDVSAPTERWHANRLVNEALLSAVEPQLGPVHINVPLSEPLFGFGTEALPAERVIHRWRAKADTGLFRQLWERMAQSGFQRPMVVFGQGFYDLDRQEMRRLAGHLSRCCVTVAERLSNFPATICHPEEALFLAGDDGSLLPDFILYMGDMLVSKRFRQFLRKAVSATVVMVSGDGEVHDTTMHLDTVVAARPSEVLRGLLHILDEETADKTASASVASYIERWKALDPRVERMIEDFDPPFSQMAAVRYLEQQLDDMDYDFAVHAANSSAVRLTNIFSSHPIYCNRGVNGIEGSLSTAAGFSLVSAKRVFCVIGDLSFFYDQNAFWNQNLDGRLRVVLLNNGKGGIFDLLPGLDKSEASECLVSGAHHTSAQGICTQNDIGYLQAHDMAGLQMGVVALLTEERQRPMLLEVLTDAEADAQAFRSYLSRFKPIQ